MPPRKPIEGWVREEHEHAVAAASAPLMRQVVDKQIRKMDRYNRHLLSARELAALVLKGHLAIEEALIDLLVASGSERSKLEQRSVRFIDLLNRAAALRLIDRKMERSLRMLNQLRNAVAHGLEPSGISEMIAKLYSSSRAERRMRRFSATQRKESPTSQVRLSVYTLLGGMHVLTGVLEIVAGVRLCR